MPGTANTSAYPKTTLADIPFQTINYEVFYGSDAGTRLLGTATVDLPDLNYATVDVKGAGILGTISMPTRIMPESMTVTLNWMTIHSNLTELAMQKPHKLTLYSSQQKYAQTHDSITTQQVKIEIYGVSKETPLGKFEGASQTESKSTLEVIYLVVEVGGTELINVDKVNYIFNINGVDYAAPTREDLGNITAG